MQVGERGRFIKEYIFNEEYIHYSNLLQPPACDLITFVLRSIFSLRERELLLHLLMSWQLMVMNIVCSYDISPKLMGVILLPPLELRYSHLSS